MTGSVQTLTSQSTTTDQDMQVKRLQYKRDNEVIVGIKESV